MRENLARRLGSLTLVCVMVCAAALTVGAAGDRAKSKKAASVPEKSAPKTGVTVYSNEKASVDASNLAEGYLLVKYTGGKSVRIKVQIAKAGNEPYTYDLNNAGNAETLPLTEGDGTYSVKILENTTGSRYAQAYSTSVTMTLRNDFLPFLYSNQYVNYSSGSQTVAKAAELCKDAADDLAKVGKVFDYAVDNVSYDYDFAKEVSEGKHTGYLPTVDTTLSTGKGICFDYAALMTAMLRSQNIPCKLVIGYAGQVYHAWINVYIEGTGWVDKVIYFDGTNWTLMDPTFTSSGARSDSIMKYVTTSGNYSQKYAY